MALYRARRGQLVTLLFSWRELGSRFPRVRWRLVHFLLCGDRRVAPLCWRARVVAGGSSSASPLKRSNGRFSHPRVAGSRACSPCVTVVQVGACARPKPAQVARFLTGRHVLFSLAREAGVRKGGVTGMTRERALEADILLWCPFCK